MREERVHRVLVAVKDYVNESALLSALRPTAERVHITFYHVIELPLTSPMYGDFVKPMLEKRKRALRPLIEWAERQGLEASLKVVAARDIVSSVLEEVEKERYDLVAVQRSEKSLGEKITSRLHMGLPEKLIRSLKVPVLILPPRE